jgi:hypothetical protein
MADVVMYPGEVLPFTMRLDRTDGETLTIDSATYEVFSLAGLSQGEGAEAATVAGHEVSGVVTAGETAGEYYVEFTCSVGGYVKKHRQYFRVA